MYQMVVIMQLSLLKGYMDAPVAMQGTWWNFLTLQLIPEVQAWSPNSFRPPADSP